MIKVSMVAYLVGGAFLNLAYWDVPYYLFVAIAITRSILRSPARVDEHAAGGVQLQPLTAAESSVAHAEAGSLSAGGARRL
jgi:hypothetical protein